MTCASCTLETSVSSINFNFMDASEKAKEIISKILYATVATSSKDGQPWNSPLYVAYDENYNFFWASWTGTQHSKNIIENPRVFLTIYDSTVPEGSGEGVYIQANASQIEATSEILRILPYLYGRKNKAPRAAEEFQGEYPRRIYKAVPERTWVNLDSEMNGSHIDTRKEITL
jgi:uncharacterized protein YhbP (UPF0306 family)